MYLNRGSSDTEMNEIYRTYINIKGNLYIYIYEVMLIAVVILLLLLPSFRQFERVL